MRGFLIFVAVVAVVGVLALPAASGYMVKRGFAEPTQPWAANAVFRGARIQVLLQQYPRARANLENAMLVFPAYPSPERPVYWIALCYEKEENVAAAVQAFNAFLTRYPNHPWADQARRHIAQLQAGQM